MEVVTGIPQMKERVRRFRSAGRTVGLVPTMGFLHQGHLSLVRECRKRCGATVVSLFVNPTQFGPNEDFNVYPRDFERDRALLEKEGVDVLFHPSAAEMFPAGYKTFVEVTDLQERLCGRSRPGHFRGVATVVLKLFAIVDADRAFFGQKDAQQAIILEKMAEDLNLDVALDILPIVREADGLAMSSRNAYLSPEERKAAGILSRSLEEARIMTEAGVRRADKVIGRIKAMIEAEPLARLDYVEAVDPAALEPVAEFRGDVLIALAVVIGRTRLIDNIIISSSRKD